jgi:hypothetical protein
MCSLLKPPSFSTDFSIFVFGGWFVVSKNGSEDGLRSTLFLNKKKGISK